MKHEQNYEALALIISELGVRLVIVKKFLEQEDVLEQDELHNEMCRVRGRSVL